MLPADAQALVRQKAATAMERLGKGDFAQVPLMPSKPMQLDIGIKNYRPVEMLSCLPGVDRIDSHTVRFRDVQDMDGVMAMLAFVTGYSIELSP
eukprot:SAG31_NODE_4007_length_3670_cov_1.628955_3_plen_94_part_00